VCKADLTTFMCRLSRNLGAPTSWNPRGLSRPVQGLLNLFTIWKTTINVHLLAFILTEEVSSLQHPQQRCIYTTRVPIRPSLHVYFIGSTWRRRVAAAGTKMTGGGVICNSANQLSRIRDKQRRFTTTVRLTNCASVRRT
jgi:hypothetical protein